MSAKTPDEWRLVGNDLTYWYPDNTGFDALNSKFVCSKCKAEAAFNLACGEGCASSRWYLGSGRNLPSIICGACQDVVISWSCPRCGANQPVWKAFTINTARYALQRRSGDPRHLFRIA
ncbi:MAG: hypothetical protein NTX56_10190 [Proteobacteria bacterium]|nr:hypothetical protein [Pseudomonadota bacterium]